MSDSSSVVLVGNNDVLRKTAPKAVSHDLWVVVIGLILATSYHIQNTHVSSQAAVGTYLGLLGPLVTMQVSATLYAGKKERFLLDYYYVAIFAAASASIAGGILSSIPLILLNISGAFMDGVLLILNEVTAKQLPNDYKLTILESFRGTFFGVWTSYSGMVVEFVALSMKVDNTTGLLYLLSTLLFSAFSHELGLRLGGYFVEQKILGADFMISMSMWIPYVSSYIAFSLLFSLSTVQLLLSYVLSPLGCYWASAVDDGGSMAGPFLTNSIATLMALSVVIQCERNRYVCNSAQPFTDEFIGSFCGAGSAFTNSAQIVHDLLVSSLPEKFADNTYYGGGNGSDCLKEYHAIKDRRKARNGFLLRVIGDVSIAMFSLLSIISLNQNDAEGILT
mmetsp:Transcript_17439/g.21116  ORF Transcript_17439/g.21116 Transcript_17439/m.21116 type:complete len:392 (-) Transcript_17439:1657-2832(-)|eukprot:CAMPEP_0184033276 /NCGR_PEP_ID=MMETSP0955-20130417/3656_1 /TAXON_ID=627963 /ORGANISM="Aplanochytrium sp, Strain PBS07" /LENGTH=391 /DNA_ID=CAMNT_0026319595 /DNA_START=12 /DNA_END=1187 /DNA_ORIENTATION=+